jgi:hypothetical protein
MIVEPEIAFRSLSEAVVRAALADLNPKNPVAAEVVRLVAGYTQNLAEHCERMGYIPTDFLRLTPRWPIEAVALELVKTIVREQIAAATA